MSSLIFTFEREWIESKKEEFGNPIRKMERFVRENPDAKLIKSDKVSFTVEVEKDKREQFVDEVWRLVKETFNEQDPGACIHVGGDSRDLKLPTLKEEQEETPEQPKKAPEEPVEEQKAPKKMEETPVQPVSAEVPQEECAVGTESLMENLCKEVPMCFSGELADYLRELGQVVPMLERMNAGDCVWSQNLLVAMDSGCGFTSFVNVLQRAYAMLGIADGKAEVKELIVKKEENAYAGWQKAVDAARALANSVQNRRDRIVLALDVRKWQSELETPEVREYLRQISKHAAQFICVFRVSFMEGQVINRISDSINDLMPLRTLVVPPISVAHMITYFRDQVYRLNCLVDKDCDDLIERWIVREKSDGSFFMYRSLEKMAQQIVLHKALVNCQQGAASRTITSQDIAAYLGDAKVQDDPYEQLAKLVGMEHVQQRIQEIVVQIKTQKELATQGNELGRPSIHMMFTGNPGTGKTTVARLLAQIMKQEGVLSKGLLYEVRGRDLCGRYVGETAPRTSTYCRDAYGSILFIDEAYSLYQRDMGRDYGKEAIATLVAEMENHRDDFCVIMAGYPDEMKEMMEANAGLEGRISYIIDFPNYTREELEEIFFRMLDGKLKYDEGLRETMKELFQGIPQEVMEDKNFSNARMVRNLFERTWGKAAYRRFLMEEREMVILKEDAISAFEEGEFKKLVEDSGRKRRIGFLADGGEEP